MKNVKRNDGLAERDAGKKINCSRERLVFILGERDRAIKEFVDQLELFPVKAVADYWLMFGNVSERCNYYMDELFKCNVIPNCD